MGTVKEWGGSPTKVDSVCSKAPWDPMVQNEKK